MISVSTYAFETEKIRSSQVFLIQQVAIDVRKVGFSVTGPCQRVSIRDILLWMALLVHVSGNRALNPKRLVGSER